MLRKVGALTVDTTNDGQPLERDDLLLQITLGVLCLELLPDTDGTAPRVGSVADTRHSFFLLADGWNAPAMRIAFSSPLSAGATGT
jgi:hypothetical protein